LANVIFIIQKDIEDRLKGRDIVRKRVERFLWDHREENARVVDLVVGWERYRKEYFSDIVVTVQLLGHLL